VSTNTLFDSMNRAGEVIYLDDPIAEEVIS